VQLAFLEFMSPTLPAACAELVAAGCTHIDVVPLFLGSGGHVRKDLPLLLDAVRAEHAPLSVQLHPSIGELQAVMQAMAVSAAAVLGVSSPAPQVQATARTPASTP
jgi:sirohydrochlorin cobaltochelatase